MFLFCFREITCGFENGANSSMCKTKNTCICVCVCASVPQANIAYREKMLYIYVYTCFDAMCGKKSVNASLILYMYMYICIYGLRVWRDD